ncbi:YigZ family protein [Herbivorax sp. ANBcel31]|uniref:YigZ family protein n=1 Tax=Herbivorax sp. ANBcel31 TaxID=3069754 RepID=UPI0027B06EBB|nr:YigZ family protein [Herbivorax sp. ANBcel31]MDQ2086419.1 YigZ family protein [Herbivorax sp. ANBcel31]
MDSQYKTVLKFAIAELEEKKSRFIASVMPVSSEEKALSFINEIKTKNWDATHNVYSYYIEGSNIVQRFSDDGEPSGTAGLPILEVIKRMEVRNLVVVVTRHFGGTLLGAAGLIRAYGKSASLAIEEGGIVTKKLCTEVSIVIEYDLFGKIKNMLISKDYIIKDIIYEQDVEIIVFVEEKQLGSLVKTINEITNTRSIVEPGNKSYITLDAQGKLIV